MELTERATPCRSKTNWSAVHRPTTIYRTKKKLPRSAQRALLNERGKTVTQYINIPDLPGAILVDYAVSYTVNGKQRNAEKSDKDPYDASLKLPQGDHNAEIKVWVMLTFPALNREGEVAWENWYIQNVSALLRLEIQKGQVISIASEKRLQGETFNPGAMQKSPFRFIEGRAWLNATQSPRYYALKFMMVVGSSEIKVDTWETNNQDPSWKGGVEFGGDSKKASVTGVIDTITKFFPKVGFERIGAAESRSQGGSRTPGQLAQTREWTVILEVPEPKQVPKPVIYSESFTHPVYFDTNRKEIGKYLHPQNKTDQLQDLIRVVDTQIAKYGKENIRGVEVRGHASRLGDTLPNINLSEARAKHVADFLKRFYKFKISDEDITFRGEPVDEGNNKDNSWKDRVVWVSINAVRQGEPLSL